MGKSESKSLNKWLFLLSYAPEHKSGAGISTFDFAGFLAKQSFEPTILTLNRKFRENPAQTIDNVPIRRIPYLNHNVFTKLISLVWIQFFYLFYCIRNHVIWITGGKTIGLEFMLLWCWVLNRKVIFRSTMHGSDDMFSMLNGNFILSKIRRFLFSKIRIYYSLHPGFTISFENYFPSGISVFHSVQGVDLSRFTPKDLREKEALKKKLEIQENKFVIVTLGVLTNRKGFPELIDFLSNAGFDYKWIVLGEKDFGKEHFLEHKMNESIEIQKMGENLLGEKVEFRGWAGNPEEYLNAADVFLLGGHREGIPNAALQAMSCGLPSLIKDNPGFSEMLGAKENAVLLYNTREELLDILHKLMHEEAFHREISNSALKFAQRNFRYEKIIAEILTLLEDRK